MKKMDKRDIQTPFVDALKSYVEEGISPFDVPGHHMGNVNNEMTALIGKKVYKTDVNAPYGLDNLAHPSGVILEAEKLMAHVCHADYAYFLINGTSSGLIAAVMTICKPTDKIILPRNVHKSLTNALVLSGAVPIYVEPHIDSTIEIANQPSLDEYKRMILRYPSAKAVVVINPTYFGVIADLRSIVEFAHERNMAVIVDEAHGAHYYLTNNDPVTAMDAGADVSAISFHKTAGSLTQSSVLLVKGNRVPHFKFQETLNLMNTTSPSSLLIGSLDAARAHIQEHGEEISKRVIAISEKAYNEINKIPGFIVRGKDYFKSSGAFNYDKTKLLIEIDRLDINGYDVYRLLKTRYHVQVELAETYVILCILALGTTDAHLNALIKALKSISKEHFKKNRTYPTHSFSFKYGFMLTRPRTAFFAPGKTVPLRQALNHISKESIVIYPPGIPVIQAGEVFSKDIIFQIEDGLSKQCTILSNHNRCETVDIIDEEKWKNFNFYKKRLHDYVKNELTTPRRDGYYLPFEGDKHQGTIVLLPFRRDVWRNHAKEATEQFKGLIKAIARFEKIYVGVHPSIYKKSLPWLERIPNVIPIRVKYNDAWARDNTLIFLRNKRGDIRSVDFRFNAWGGDYDGLYTNYQDDDALGSQLVKKLGVQSYRLPSFVMEGGSITTDGEGTLIATEACFLSKGRNPSMSKAEIEETLKVYLGVNDIIWIPHGIIGDETDEHVDNMVTFSRPGEVLLAWPSTADKVQYVAATKALKILESTKDAKGRPIKVIKVKMPNPIYLSKEEARGIYSKGHYGAKPRKAGTNLLATYINFYQSDRFVILPSFGVKEDTIVLKQFREIFPEKEIIQIPSKEILIGGGNIHCVTMQIPKGGK